MDKVKFAINIFLILLLVVFSNNFSYGQENNIQIKFIGNCGLHLTDGKFNFYVDFPYKSGAYNYMEYDKSEVDNIAANAIFIFTHRHLDHFSKKLVKRQNGKILETFNIGRNRKISLEELNDSVSFLSVKAFKTKHRFSFKHYSYLIKWHGKKIFISGDTEHAEIFNQVKGIDWAFVPVWILQDANEKNIKIDVEQIGLYHIGQNDDSCVQPINATHLFFTTSIGLR
jgi:L-ascorbate metabolism protein UlaG (beta-lactamase superfamily)